METINNIFKNRCLFRMVMRILILVAMFGKSSVAYSQAGTTYPVEINAMLTPPYGTCLTDYVGTNRFQCNVLMRDMRATEYYFRIVMTVKDQASGRVVFQTQSDRKNIAPGKPVYMAETGIFGEFFKSTNIKYSGVYSNGCLKEGAYNFVFQVVDDKDSRHIPISKECVFTARLNEGGAPLLTFPFTGDSIGCDATPINLTWQMPFVTGEQIEYLVEVCPNYNGISGLDCLNNNSKPANFYYSARSFMPMHQLVKTTTMLTPNTTYYWRVSIIDQFGKIKPNSTSKIDSFVYCGTPIEPEPYIPVKEPMVKAIAANLDTVKFDSVLTKDNSTKAYWTLDEVRFNYIAYALDVRKKSQDTWSTYHIEIKQEDPEEKDNYGLSNLKYNEPYEARMQYLKLSDNGDTLYAPYSDTITFTVPNPMDTADCGEILPIKDCNDAKGLVLKQYDTLYANGTPVVLDSVTYKSGDSSVISGFGTVAFPILSNFKLKMQFKEISVNCYGELLKGKVVSVYNESTGAIIDLNHMFGKGDGGGSQSSSEQPEPKKYASKEEAQKNLSTGGFAQVGDSIYTKDPSGNLVPLGKSISMTDEQYTNNNRLDEDNVYCVFHNDTENAEYIGFDADEQNVFRHVASLKDHYESFSKQAGSSDPYIIPYVASNPGRVVKLTATLDGKGWDGTYNKDSVKFVMPLSGGNYLSLNAKKDGDKFIVDFPGSTPDTHSDVYAIALKGTQYVNVGKIIVESYEWRKQKVKFVPVVNDYTVDTDAISKELNKIYGRFGISYEVTKDDKYVADEINSDFLNSFSIGSGVFTKQSDDMKRLQYSYKKDRGIEDSTAYLFLLKNAAENGTIDGDMPQGQICGYIFMHSDGGEFKDGRLAAHELAHGVYKLDHVFEKAYGIKENSTNNLLDYNNGNQLAHHQWELIKNPGFAWALLESDEENFYVEENQTTEIIRFISSFRCAKDRGKEFFAYFHSKDRFNACKACHTSMKSILSHFNGIASESIYNTYVTFEFLDKSMSDNISRRVYLGYKCNQIRTKGYVVQNNKIYFAPDKGGFQLVVGIKGNVNALEILCDYLGISNNPAYISNKFVDPNIKDLRSLLTYSLCEFENLTFKDRKVIFERIAKIINESWFDKDTYWELARNIILSAPEEQRPEIRNYFNTPSGKVLYNALCEHTSDMYVSSLLSRSTNNNGVSLGMKEAASLAAHSYGDKGDYTISNYGWRISHKMDRISGFVFVDEVSGFKSKLYEKEIGGETVYCYATAGTDFSFSCDLNLFSPVTYNFSPCSMVPLYVTVPTPNSNFGVSVDADSGDLSEDAWQALLGHLGPQYDITAKNALLLNEVLKNSKLVFVGHSLGGALAATNTLMTGRPGYTFNAAGLKTYTLDMMSEINNPDVKNYVINGEFVNKANKYKIIRCWYCGSEPVYIDGKGDCKGGHSIDCFLK